MSKSKYQPEDAELVAAIQELLGDDVQLSKFGSIHCLKANGVTRILSAKVIYIGGKRAIVVGIAYRPGYFNFGNGPLTTKGKLRTGAFVIKPKGWLRIAPEKYWVKTGKDKEWTRFWKPVATIFYDSAAHCESSLTVPESKWMPRGRGIVSFPREKRVRQPEGRLSVSGIGQRVYTEVK